MYQDLFLAAIATVLSLILVPIVGKFAVKVGATDQPDARKVHTRVMPRMGGLAIYLSFMLVVLFTQPMGSQLIGLMVGATLLIIVGIIDDITDMDAKKKLLGQIIAASIAVAGGTRVEFMTSIIDKQPFSLEWLVIPVTIIWIVGITNAVNLIDGLDGLAGGISIIAAITIGIVGYDGGLTDAGALAFILAGSTLGFLRYNFYPAKIFMGDTGSMFLGYSLAVLAILSTTKSVTFVSLFTPLLVLGIPIFDTLFAILRRGMNNQPIFVADKAHLHHCLLRKGYSHRMTVLLMYGLSILLALCGYALQSVSTAMGITLVMVVAACLLFGANRLGILSRPKPEDPTSGTPESKQDA